MVNRLTTELYLQQFSGLVIANRRERTGLHGKKYAWNNLLLEAFALKQNSMKMLLSEQYWG
jgi:hypothetical protein